MKLFRNNKKGFTLVELMIVVVILGILVAIAVPIYNSFTKDAEDNADAANIRTLQSMVIQMTVNEKADLKDIDLTPDPTSGVVTGITGNIGTSISTSTGSTPYTKAGLLAEVKKYIIEWPTTPDGTGYYYVVDGVVVRQS